MKISKKSGNIFLISSTLCLMLGLNSTGANALSKDFTEDKNSQVISVTNAEANEQFEQTDNSKAIFASVAHRLNNSGINSTDFKGFDEWQDGYCYQGYVDGSVTSAGGGCCSNCVGEVVDIQNNRLGCNPFNINSDATATYGYNLPAGDFAITMTEDGFFKGLPPVITSQSLSTKSGGCGSVKDYFYRYWRPDGNAGTYSPAYPIICYSGFNGVYNKVDDETGKLGTGAKNQFGERYLNEGEVDFSKVKNAYSAGKYIAEVNVRNKSDQISDGYGGSYYSKKNIQDANNKDVPSLLKSKLVVYGWQKPTDDMKDKGCLDPLFGQTTDFGCDDNAMSTQQLIYNEKTYSLELSEVCKPQTQCGSTDTSCGSTDIAVLYKDTNKKEPYKQYYKVAVNIPGNERWQDVPIANCFLCKGINSGYPGTSCNDILQTLYDSYCITQANSCECMVKTLVLGPRDEVATLPSDMLTGANCSVCMASLETNLKGKYGCPSN